MAINQLRVEAEEDLKKDKLALYVFVLCILSILIQASLILTSWPNLPPKVPIFYSQPWGEKILASAHFLWILPATSALVLAVNFSLKTFLVRNWDFLSKTLFIFALIVAIATAYDTVKIISLVG